MSEALFALLGMIVGAVGAAVFLGRIQSDKERLSAGQAEADQRRRAEEQEAFLERVESGFQQLSRNALAANSDEFLKLAGTRFEQQSKLADHSLDSKKRLIDGRVEEIDKKLASLNALIQQAERQRSESHGSLKTQLEKATQATNLLQSTTGQLREALAGTKSRGQWGERMAEDVLRLAGFVEHVNYTKQEQIDAGTFPDFTFPLPGDQRVHMDVKFPLDNYLKTLEAPDSASRTAATARFLKDVRARIREVTTREYINPAEGTVDYVIVFIPNEQVYAFIHENDHGLLDDALRSKVVLCSPLTLYAILAVIRQGVDNFHLQESSHEILRLLAAFKKQWDKYAAGMDKMGDRLEAAMKEYQALTGTRTRMLERQLDKIENLREQQAQKESGGDGERFSLPGDD